MSLGWQPATLVGVRPETATARTLILRVPTWPGHVAGQHLDVRLTAADGYTAVRSYSIASAHAADTPAAGEVELTIEQILEGEVSPYLATRLGVGDRVEVRGPIGRWFVWRPSQSEPIQLVAGGSGIAPIMAMVRASRPLVADGALDPMRLLYSTRGPETAIFGAELHALHEAGLVELTMAYTRTAPEGWPRPVGRLAPADVAAFCWGPDAQPTCYVCGPNGFVESAAELLLGAGHDPDRIRTERFGAP